MSDETKLMLSADELALAGNRDIILTKRSVIEKAMYLFSSLQNKISEVFRDMISREALPVSSMPKISKGENYKGFPYVIMDHPAVFGKENIFAVRTMFWWGNFISITLHLSGEYRERFKENIFKNLMGDLLIAAGTDEWQHDLAEENYCRVSDLTAEQKARVLENDFLKIAIINKLEDWNRMTELLNEGYGQILNLIIG